MRLSFSLLALCICFWANAQITFNSADLPIPGDSLPTAQDTLPSGVGPGNAGANQTYVLTNVTPRVYQTSVHQTVAQSGYSGTFPTATNAITPDGASYGFFKKTTSAYTGLGLAGDLLQNGSIFTVTFSPTFDTYHFPTQYGGSFSGNYGFVQTASGSQVGQPVDQVRITFTSTYTDNIDGWGTVTTPVGTYDCLRQHRVENTHTLVEYKLFSFSPWATLSNTYATVHAYNYLTKEAMGPVATVNADSTNTVTSVTWSLIPPAPVADFTWTNPYGGHTEFTDQSTGSVAGYLWDFGDGATSTQQNPTHTYPANGSYTVCLTVYDNYGGVDSVCMLVVIDGIFSANVSGPMATCENELTNLSFSTPLTAGHTYTWSATNGTVNTGQGTNSITASFTGTPASVTVTECDATGNYCDPDSYTVTVLSVDSTTVSETVCYGQSYYGHSATGTYTDVFTGANGCDSVRTLNLTVRAKDSTAVTTSICAGSSYLGYNSSGTYTDHYTDANGCDSARTLILTVRPANATTVNASICTGASYYGHTTAGTYVDQFTDRFGCDSTRTLNLTVQSYIIDSLPLSICYNTSYQGYNATGTYSDTFPTANCDSIRVLLLTVLPEDLTSYNVTICAGESQDGYTTTGIYTDMFTDQYGCDSTRRLNLTVLPASSSTIDTTICFGESFLGHSATGNYTDTLTAANSCDSVIALTLTVLPPNITSYTEIICYGDTLEGYTASGSYTDHFTDANGCDSARTLHLTVRLQNATTVNHTMCPGQSFAGYTSAGTYTDVFTDQNGCDSTRTLNLTVSSQIVDTVTKSACLGDTIEGYFTTGVYSDTFTLSGGCDSIRVLDLTIGQYILTTVDTTVCDGESVFAGGSMQTTSGTYFDTISHSGSCDEVITTNLTVTPLPTAPTITQSGDTISVPDANDSYIWSLDGTPIDSTSGSTLVVTQNGSYTVEVSNNGCSATSQALIVTGVGIAEFNLADLLSIYPNPTSGLLYIELKQQQMLHVELVNTIGQVVWTGQTGNGKTTTIDMTQYPEGMFFIRIYNDQQVAVRKVMFAK